MGTFFEEGGFGMYPTALFGFVLLAGAVLTVLRPARFWRLTAVMSGVTLCSGLLGTCIGIINTMKFVAHTTETELVKIGATGIAESTNNLVLALVIVIPAALLCAVAAGRTARTAAA
jgi:hypothetical protein